MNEINEMVAIPDEMLDSIVGGVFNDDEKETIRTIAQQLKQNGYPYKNTMAWLHEQCAGYRFSEEQWKEIESIVKSVYES